jgi:hypothetical protein
MAEDAQEVWAHYFERIRNRRVAEASEFWAIASADGLDENSNVALDFRFFAQQRDSLHALKSRLDESYQVTVSEVAADETYFLDGTTRPYGITLSRDKLLSWVAFMADLGRDHAVVFSTWKVADPKRKREWTSEEIETDDD